MELDFGDFCLPKRIQKSDETKVQKNVEQQNLKSTFGAGPAECAVPGERLDRGQKAKSSRILEKDFRKEIVKS